MSPLVVNRKLTSRYDVYVGRPTKWGNPFREGSGCTRRQAITKYAVWLFEQRELMEKAGPELGEKVLACSCRPRECHADVLAEVAKEQIVLPQWNVDKFNRRVYFVIHGWVLLASEQGSWATYTTNAYDPIHFAESVGSLEVAKYMAVERWVQRAVFGENP